VEEAADLFFTINGIPSFAALTQCSEDLPIRRKQRFADRFYTVSSQQTRSEPQDFLLRCLGLRFCVGQIRCGAEHAEMTWTNLCMTVGGDLKTSIAIDKPTCVCRVSLNERVGDFAPIEHWRGSALTPTALCRNVPFALSPKE
jgi:hypothetical protein